MKTMLDPLVRQELVDRINNVPATASPCWGKMNLYQMFTHCAIAEESYLGKTHYPRTILGRFIGQAVLNKILNADLPLGRNAKTLKPFVVTGDGDVEHARKRWLDLIAEYEKYSMPGITHWFFGAMTREQAGYFSYKHADHHLRQFNC